MIPSVTLQVSQAQSIRNMTKAVYSRYSDAELMTQLSQGEMEALGELYIRYGDLVACAVSSTVPTLSRWEVEDLCQDVFIAVKGSATKYKNMGKFKSWIYSVAVRTAKNRRRSITIHQRILGGASAGAQDQPVAMGVQRACPEAGAMVRVDIARVFERLPLVQRQLLVLFEHQGLSGEEIADLLGMKLNTVWSHLRRARASVLEALDGPNGRKTDRRKP